MTSSKDLIIAASLFFTAAGASAQNNMDVHLVNTFHVASPGGWDYLAVQPHSDKLFLSHGNQVNIINKKNGDSLGIIPNTMGVHGIAFIPSLNKGYTSNGRSNTVTVFDLKSNAVLSQIETGQNPDAIFYDEYSKMIVTCNGRTKDLSIIDPLTEKVMHSVAVGGRPETAVSNNAGKIFVNIEDKNEIVVVNAKTFGVENHWALAPGEAPTGLAIDTKTHRLFAGCGDNKWLIIMDTDNGTIIDKVAIGNGCDGVAFDSSTGYIYASNGDGTLSVVKEEGPDKFAVMPTIVSKKGARTITIDTDTHAIYLPTADFEAAPAANGRPKTIPGTFQVLMYSK